MQGVGYQGVYHDVKPFGGAFVLTKTTKSENLSMVLKQRAAVRLSAGCAACCTAPDVALWISPLPEQRGFLRLAHAVFVTLLLTLFPLCSSQRVHSSTIVFVCCNLKRLVRAHYLPWVTPGSQECDLLQKAPQSVLHPLPLKKWWRRQ